MEILEMIAKWRKGCLLSGGHPSSCLSCTEKLINDIEKECNRIPELDEAFLQSLERLISAQALPLATGQHDGTLQVMVSKRDLNILIRGFIAAEFLLYEEISKNGQL